MNKTTITLLLLISAVHAKPPQQPAKSPNSALAEAAAAQMAAAGAVSDCLAEAQAGGAGAVTFVRRRPPALFGSAEFKENQAGRLKSFTDKHGGLTSPKRVNTKEAKFHDLTDQ
jgi:hypothetical protein